MDQQNSRETENNQLSKIKAKFMLIKSQKKESKPNSNNKKFEVFKTTKENPIKKPFKCFQIEKKTHSPLESNSYNEATDYYGEYWKIFNDNEDVIEKIKESVYEIHKMKEYLKGLENKLNEGKESNQAQNKKFESNNEMDID